MFNVGPMELVLILVLGLLVFGPERLPSMARTLATWIARIRDEAGRSIAELKAAADVDDITGEIGAIRDELRATRDEVTRGLRAPVTAVEDAVKDVSPGGPTAHAAPAAQVPPMDPEAT